MSDAQVHKASCDTTAVAADAALESMQRTSLWLRAVTLAGILILLGVTIIFSMLTLSRVTSELAVQQQSTVSGHQLLKSINAQEQILQRVTGKPAQNAQATETQHLIVCLYNRIDYDTGKTARLLPSCDSKTLIPAPGG